MESIIATVFFGVVAGGSMFLACIARNPIKRSFLIGFGILSGVFSAGPLFIKSLMENYPLTIMVIGLVVGYYLITSLWRAMNHQPVCGLMHMIGVIICIIVLVVGGRQFTMAFFHNVVSEKAKVVSNTTHNFSDTVSKSFQKVARPFWKIEESDFSIHVDRNLLNSFSGSDMAIVEARLRDLARAMGEDSDDSKFENLFIGGQITISDGEIVLISLANAGREEIDLGMVVPSRGGRLKSRPGLEVLNPSDVELKINGDTVTIVSSLINVAIDHNGEIHCDQLPQWN